MDLDRACLLESFCITDSCRNFESPPFTKSGISNKAFRLLDRAIGSGRDGPAACQNDSRTDNPPWGGCDESLLAVDRGISSTSGEI